MGEFEGEMPLENPLVARLKGKVEELGFKLHTLEEVDEGAFTTILSNKTGHTGPYVFFTGEVVGVIDDPIDWNKQRIFDPDFRVYHYCPILETEIPTPNDMIGMLEDAKDFVHEVEQLSWKAWIDKIRLKN
ncbi:hypothetical protein HYT18_03090 [Candidatus Microgenomates bacterium]|nr:hypothetical protein [Candidatus Microgenomates bacterium]